MRKDNVFHLKRAHLRFSKMVSAGRCNSKWKKADLPRLLEGGVDPPGRLGFWAAGVIALVCNAESEFVLKHTGNASGYRVTSTIYGDTTSRKDRLRWRWQWWWYKSSILLVGGETLQGFFPPIWTSSAETDILSLSKISIPVMIKSSHDTYYSYQLEWLCSPINEVKWQQISVSVMSDWWFISCPWQGVLCCRFSGDKCTLPSFCPNPWDGELPNYHSP